MSEFDFNLYCDYVDKIIAADKAAADQMKRGSR